MRYAPEVISREEEEALLDKLPALAFKSTSGSPVAHPRAK
jgi:hypothetical protein